MYTNSHSQKRFPTACRFFAQGICRAGQSCSFAHILPLEGEPDNSAHAVLFGDAIDDSPGAFSPQHIAGSTTDSHSLQKAIRDLELDQLQKIYDVHYLRTSVNDSYTLVEIFLPLAYYVGDLSELHLHLVIPLDYPDSPCSIRLQNPNISNELKWFIQNAFEEHEWHQPRHVTLVQQLDWLSINFATLLDLHQNTNSSPL